jgi:hypothetical protein
VVKNGFSSDFLLFERPPPLVRPFELSRVEFWQVTNGCLIVAPALGCKRIFIMTLTQGALAGLATPGFDV